MLTNLQIRDHYNTPDIIDTIIRISTDGKCSRAGMKFIPNIYIDKKTGALKGSMNWYNCSPESCKRGTKINLSNRQNYMNAVVDCRTLYWTLNYFEPEIYEIDFKNVEKSEKTAISRSHTAGYTFGIDIDCEHGMNIHNQEVKRALEDMAQFFSDKLRKYTPNSVYCLYSGGGIYVMLHHKVFEPYFEKFRDKEEWDVMLLTLLDAFDYLIGDLRDEFFKLHSEHVEKVKPDQLNNSQRVFKTIYSIHKSLDYAVIPLDPLNIHINFERATIPLSKEVIEEGKSWYNAYDDGREFLNQFLKPYLEKSYNHRKKLVTGINYNEIAISSVSIDNMGQWAPCMRNIYNLQSCSEGRTRALAIFVSFLGQIGIEESQSQLIFDELADRWGAEKSNIFESYFRKMKVPTCARLTSEDNRGFPKGVSIKNLDVCKPDARCFNVPSPRYYTDREANINRLLFQKPEAEKEEKEF